MSIPAQRTANPKVLLLVPDGVGFRNFVLGRLPGLLSQNADVALLHGLPGEAVSKGLGEVRLTSVERMPVFQEPPIARLLREAKPLGQLYWRHQEDAGDLQLLQRRARGSWRNRAFGSATRILARAMATPTRLDLLDHWHERAARQSKGFAIAQDHLRRLSPDVVFCTHQRASTAVVWMAAARSLQIPTVTFVYSWDNPPKGRMAVPADHLLLWGRQMHEEVQLYYPNWPNDQLHVLGTPQFEPYWEDRILSRDAFFDSQGLDTNRAVICFSGDDYSSSPRDQDYLADLAHAIRTLPSADRPQILFRRCPVDRSDRYDSVLQSFPEIVSCPPIWKSPESGDWQQILPTEEDVTLLANIVHHCDAVVNYGSTMALDFALQGKPALYFAYEPTGASGTPAESNSYGRTWTAAGGYRLPHFRLLHELEPVTWLRDVNELASSLQQMLNSPQAKAEQRQQWIDRILTAPADQASQRIAECLLNIAAS